MARTISLLVLLSSATVLPALAAPQHLATIESECAMRLKLPPGGCACIAKGAADLSDAQQAFIVAALTKDKAAQTELTQSLTVAQLTEAGTFMARAPAQCAQGE